jgi:hypothetical protein
VTQNPADRAWACRATVPASMLAIVAHKLELSCRCIFSGGLFCAIHGPQTVRCVLPVVTTDESSHKTSGGDPLLGSGALGWHGKRAKANGATLPM